MSGAVDTKAVEMRFDNSNFEKNAKQSISTLEKLKQALRLDGASAGLKEVEKASKKLDFKDSVDSYGKKFSVLETIATGALLGIGSAAAETGMRIAKSLTLDQVSSGWSKYEQKITAVQTIMANLRDTEREFIDSSDKMDYVNGYLEKLMWFSDETSYSFTEMTSNLGKFVAVGQGLDDSVTAIQGIATWAALAGQRSEGAARAMYNISQALGVGAMTTIDWKSIENANMATAEFKELAISIGEDKGKLKKGQVTIENFRESLQKKWFDKEVMMDVFKTFGEAADKLQDYYEKTGMTATEMINQIKDGNTDLAKSIGIDVNSVGWKAFLAAQEAKTFGEVVDATADAVSTKWLRIFENIFGNYEQAKKVWSDFAEDLYDVLAAPLDTLNDIMSMWNRGFFKDGPKNVIQQWFEGGKLDTLGNDLSVVSMQTAKMAVANDKATYSIIELEGGVKKLQARIKDENGVYQLYTKDIYEADKDLISGREQLMASFSNIFDTLFHDVYDKNDELESMSFLGAIKRGLLEAIFGTSELSEVIPIASKKLWELTNRFKEFTEKLKPSMSTSLKIKEVFKGFFTIFKIVGKVVKAVIKPFKDLFSGIFAKKEGSKGLLDLAESMSKWIQQLDEYIDKSGVLATISDAVSNGITAVKTALDNLSKALTGLSAKDLIKKIKDDLFGFFENYDFKGTYNTVVGFFTGIVNDLKATSSEELPKELTPLQRFWIGVKGIFTAMKKFFSLFAPVFQGIGTFIGNTFSTIADAFSNKKTEKGVSRFAPIWEGIKSIFQGIGDFFAKIGPTLSKIGQGFGNFFRTLGDSIATWAEGKSPEDIIQSIVKGGFIISLTNLINAISSLGKGGGRIGKALAKDLNAVKGVLKAYQTEILADSLISLAIAVGIFAGSMWVLAQIPSDKMQQASDALFTIAVALGAFSVLKDKLKASSKTIGETADSKGGLLAGLKDMMTSTVSASIFANDKTAKFVKIALGILFAAIAAKKLVDAVGKMGDTIVKLAKIPESQLKQGGKIVTQIIGLFAVFALFSGFSKKASSGLFAALGALILVKAVSKLVDLLASLGADAEKMDNIQKAVDKFSYVFTAVKQMAMWVVKIAAALTIAELLLAAFSTGKLTDTLAMSKVMKQFGKNFLRVAAALVIIGLAFALMARVAIKTDANNFNAVSGFFIAFYSIVGGLQTVSIGLASYSKDTSNIADIMKEFGKNFTRIAASLLIVAAAFWLMSKIEYNNASFGGIALIFAAFLAVVGWMTANAVKASSMKKSEYFIKNLKSIANLFIAVALSMAVVAGAFAIMAALQMTTGEMFSIMAIFGIVAVIVGVFAAISMELATQKKSEYFGKNMKAIANMCIAVSASLVIVAAAFAIMSALDFSKGADFWDIAAAFGGFMVLVGAIALVAKYVGKDKNYVRGVEAIAALFLGISVSLVIVASAFAIMAHLNMEPKEMWTVAGIFGAFAGVVAVLAIVGAAIGKLGKLNALDGILAIGALMVAFAISLTAVALAFGAMAKSTSVDQMKKVIGIIAVFGGVVAGLAIIGGLLGALGSPLAIGGMAAIAGIILAIGAACLMAGVGIGIAADRIGLLIDAFANLITAIAEKGPQFAENVGLVINAIIDAIIAAAPKIAVVGAVLIINLALGIASAAGAVAAAGALVLLQFAETFLSVLAELGPKLITGIIDAINTLANCIRDSAPLMVQAMNNLTEALIETALVGIAGLVKPFGDVGKKLAEKITKWIPKLKDAFGVVQDESANAGKDASDAFDYEFNGGGAGKSFSAKDVNVDDLYDKYIGKTNDKKQNNQSSGADSSGFDISSMLTQLGNGGISIPGVSGGVGNFADMLGIKSMDFSSFTDMFNSGFEGMDFSGIMSGKITDMTTTMNDSGDTVSASATDMAASIEKPIKSLDSKKWGQDLGINLSKGLLDKIPQVKAAASKLAEVIHEILGFSEPEKGPLSDFHTYAPDMIKLWNKGIYDNLGAVRASTTDVADTMYDGFSDALGYVSDLIDNGMSDDLTVRPVMDLSEIQNGIDSMDGMLSKADGYSIRGTARLAATAAYGMSAGQTTSNADAKVINADVGPTNNTFYISNSDPNAVAEKVSRILGSQARRQKAVWAYK